MANAIAYEALTVADAAIGPTAATATPRVRSASFTVIDAPVVYRNDGTAPTAAVTGGVLLWPGQTLIIVGEAAIRRMQFIRLLGTSATVGCVYYSEVLDAGNIPGPVAMRDDGAFIIGTAVIPMAALADDTTPDSVDEGDLGIPRMTLSRILLTRQRVGEVDVGVADDAAFTVATTPVVPMGALADETSPDSVDEGDVGAPRMTLNRILRVIPSLHDGTTEGALSMRGTRVMFEDKAAAVQTASYFGPTYTAFNAVAVLIYVKTTSLVGTTAVYTPRLDLIDDDAAGYIVWTAAATITTVTEKVYAIGPGFVTTGGYTQVVQQHLPDKFRITLVAASADASNNLTTDIAIAILVQ